MFSSHELPIMAFQTFQELLQEAREEAERRNGAERMVGSFLGYLDFPCSHPRTSWEGVNELITVLTPCKWSYFTPVMTGSWGPSCSCPFHHLFWDPKFHRRCCKVSLLCGDPNWESWETSDQWRAGSFFQWPVDLWCFAFFLRGMIYYPVLPSKDIGSQ